MKKIFIVANWKSNKTVSEATDWLQKVSSIKQQATSNTEIIICPPFTLLHLFLTTKYQLPTTFKLGAQDVSPFPDGAYTGEVSARMLKDLGVTYVMIGHSERRKYFNENDQVLANKVREALDNNLIPIFCVQGKTTPVPDGVNIILYEPLTAIGTGEADSPQDANEVAKVLKEISGRETMILYGGSVTPENVVDFCRQEFIEGVGVGGASLDPLKFIQIIDNVSKI